MTPHFQIFTSSNLQIKMKYLFSFLIALVSVAVLSAQDKNATALPENTFAVIIGIANYENENINLNYANRDARVFAEYLQSKAGGTIPSENIRLLIDTVATTAAIYNALNWLRDKCELSKIEDNGKPCKVYFYFSGHGDVETDTKANLGFLIAYNTPANNYINNAVRIEDLNNYAHTLSVDLNANVVIITDACHSGKLAGSDNKGSFLIGKELSTAKEKEIRIASCDPNELSNEDERWGGGRGVFSYYLINGLKGLADKNKDNFVTLNEIKTYVDSSIAADPVLKENKLKQTPVLEGNQQFKLSLVNKEESIALKRSLVIKDPPQTSHDHFFSLLKNNDKLESVNYVQLNALPKNDIPFAFIKQVKIIHGSNINLKKIDELAAGIRKDPKKLKLFNESLVELIHTRGQKVINLYLEGDAAELERRRYYNSKNSGYDNYPAMYSLAIKLVEADNPLAHVLQVNQLYFTGVAARLRLPFVNAGEQKILLEQALAAQQKALALEDNAAYLHNELGILYYFKKENEKAEKYYMNATMLAPDWAIPWANLCGLYADMKNKEQSFSAGQTAENLQPGLQLTNTNLGTAYELSGNYLFAEEYYRTAIDINSRHFIPFERLGYVYMNTTQYELADSFFYEADLRKRGYNFSGLYSLSNLPKTLTVLPPPLICPLDTANLDKNDIMAFFTWGVQEYMQKNLGNAKRILKKVIALDPSNPLVFHYLGKINYDEQNWETAELMFRFAENYYIDTTSFRNYFDSLLDKRTYSYKHSCIETFFFASQYNAIEDDYFLASIYESWSHYEEAELSYRRIIATDPYNIEGYAAFWQMLEKKDRYTEAETLIKSYEPYDKKLAESELNAFYRRAIDRFPEEPGWSYKLGLFLYDIAETSRGGYLDTIIWFPKLNREVFVDTSVIKTIGQKDLTLDRMDNPALEVMRIPPLHTTPKTISLPGTFKYIELALPIFTPRNDAITYLRMADSLSTEALIKADINFKIANVFVWAGSKKQAYPYYARSISLDTANANARMNFVDISKAIYKNRAGLEQLNYLYDHQQINFPKSMLYAEYCIHAGEFEKAKKILEEAQAIHPYVVSGSYDLMGRLYFISNQPERSIAWYNEYLSAKPNDPFTLYSMAKLNMQSNKSKDAWRYLEEAMKNGFHYAYVLNTDPAWENFRKDARWASLLQKYPVKEYFYPEKK